MNSTAALPWLSVKRQPAGMPPAPRKLRWLAVPALLALAAALWLSRDQSAPAPVQAPKPTHLAGLGKLMPVSDVVVVGMPFGAADARIARIEVAEGARVRAGDVLAVLDNAAQLQSSLASAEAVLGAREAALQQVAVNVDASRAESQAGLQRAVVAEKVAAADLARWQRLVAQGFVSAASTEQRQLAWQQAQAELVKARATLARFQPGVTAGSAPDVQVAQANVAVARADVARLREELNKSQVTAPFDGQVLTIRARAGERPGSEGIMTIGDTARMKLEIEVHQAHISQVHAGDTVQAQVGPVTLAGTLTHVGLEVVRQSLVDTSPAANADARVFKVTAELDAASSAHASGLSNLQVVARIVPRQP